MANEILKDLTIDGTTFDLAYVKLEGDTMTGDLNYKTEADASQADNGVDSVLYPTTFNILDKEGRILSRNESVINPSGNIDSYWYVRNYDADGVQVAQKGIRLAATKTGTVIATCDANKPASNTNNTQIATTAFTQDAINRRLPTNVIWGSVANFSCPNNSNQTKDLWTAPANGVVIATLHIQFSANASNARNVILTSSQGGMSADTKVSACSSGITKVSVTGFKQITTGGKLQAVIFQNSGAALTVSGSMVGYFIYT